MVKSRKIKRNKYQESKIRRLKGNFRKIRVFFYVFGALLTVLLLSAGMSRLYYALLDVPWLKVEEIEITGLKKLDRYTALNAIGVRKGECILNIRMSPIVERLKALPTVKTASVRLDSPGRIVAEITEREALATLKCDETLWLVDDEGLVYGQAQPGEDRSVPLIVGLCGPGIKEGGGISERSLRQIRELSAALQKSRDWLSMNSVNECRWGTQGFTLVLGERGVLVEIGKDHFSRKLAKLRKVVNTLQEKQWTELVTRIDLDYPGKAYIDGPFPAPKAAQGQGKQPG